MITSTYTLTDHYTLWAGRQAMQVLNAYKDEIFQIPPGFSQQWDPRALHVASTAPSFIEVFPNPADYLVNIQLDCPLELKQKTKLVITDITGRIVSQYEVFHAKQQLILDTLNWSNGMYIYEIDLPILGKQIGKFDVHH